MGILIIITRFQTVDCQLWITDAPGLFGDITGDLTLYALETQTTIEHGK